ncbi:glycerol kinase GlpK [Kytococcus sedentarius]|uniref:Glycerol kinase n=1 Tax=Kytococcus sedentarius (strain ATCC 14392 / DSM 20547 / JCM 11482 / CCUG 33030 / NBRC 15357 / NCTC 11040 / CCM 314 / 541) TaxID=478801 RepID=C7NI67_KYTSD|nr:glycerol kinase GlpK [Kytococcus sedentarius]ACV06574.1 glycerol kinase [Kytococcus sedentarius DSM 20547]QQB64874.1 glycerol kinase GlpK [Kytococcus sedentarius]STX14611.1 Glycerol kinase [Kytococcus sedentarius]
MSSPRYVLALDQGTTSTRAIVFDHDGRIVASDQLEHEQVLPRPGWVEHDPMEIWRTTRTVLGGALTAADTNASQVAALGITNQRETTVVWDRHTGQPVYNAIVWQDTRTRADVEELAGEPGEDGEPMGDGRFRDVCGLPLTTYFAGPKLRWILHHVEGAAERAAAGDLLFGTTDSWVIWNLTGGPRGGVHVTDVTNASRTMLMDLRTLQWDPGVCEDLDIPMSMLPAIRSSSEVYGVVDSDSILAGVPVAGALGDQHAATLGQACFTPGMAKNTYGTGNFLLLNTGSEPVTSHHGLLTTLCWKLGEDDPVYALEGSIAVTGSLVQWLRDNIGLIGTADEVEELAATVEDNGGAYFVPAFSGLFAPHWRSDARGALVGLTRYVNKGHIARAVLEATGFQTREVVDAMRADARELDLQVSELRADGGMTVNETLMQFQSDVLGLPVLVPEVSETTALGAAYAAGLAIGFWQDTAELAAHWRESRRWEPQMTAEVREREVRRWSKAVERTLDWVEDE